MAKPQQQALVGRQEKLQQEIIVPKEPPPAYEFAIDAPSISAADL